MDHNKSRKMNTKRMHPFLDESVQKKAKIYEKEKRLFALLKMGVFLVIIVAFYFSGLSHELAYMEKGLSRILTFIIYVFCFQLILFLLTLPLDYFSSYSHEHKWGFSNHTVKSWLIEQGKSFLVGLIVIWIVLGLLFFIMAEFPEFWWLIAGLGSALVSVVFSTLFPVLVFPIFNKYTPIRNKNLTHALKKILSKEGLKSSGFFMEDMSRKTKKENAFLAGLGKTRRVVLGDNLINNMSVPEIVSVMAHEIGHYKYKHIWKFIGIGTIQQIIVFFLLDRIMRILFYEFLNGIRENLSLFPLFLLIFGSISTFLFDPIGNAISRYYEKQADQYAIKNIEEKSSFAQAIAGLANRNLINAYPEKWMKYLFYSHPPVGERLEMVKK
ncbi:MAG: M48 family metallopeptidase [Acidobacteriota bacterium]